MKNKIKDYLKHNKIPLIVTAICLFLIIVFNICFKFKDVCEFVFARGISRAYIYLVSRITSIFPFSLYELTIYVVVALVIYLIVRLIKQLKAKNYRKILNGITKITAFCLTLIVLLNISTTFCFYRDSVTTQLNFVEVEINNSTAFEAAKYYANELNEIYHKLPHDENGSVISPYTFDELSKIVAKEYDEFKGNPYFNQFSVRVKPMIASQIMSYIGISGIFLPFYAESTINVHMPAYCLPVTIAHEFAHSKGVTREDEANLLAYYLMTESNDVFLRYSGLMSVATVALNEVYDSNNTNPYSEILSLMPQDVFKEYQYANDYWNSFETFIDDISNVFNNAYLTSSGQEEGVKAYSNTGSFVIKMYYTKHYGEGK